MAFGHAVKRGGFDAKLTIADDRWDGTGSTDPDGPDEQLKGSNQSNDIDGGSGDDVIIGRGGNDRLVGGSGEDDLSGGEGNDILVGGILTGADFDTAIFTQDDYSDDYNAEATFEDNGTDTILGYDADATDFEDSGVVDVIDFSDAFDFTDPTDNGEPTTVLEKEAQLNDWLAYNADGTLTDANNPDNVWFNVYSNYDVSADPILTAASTVYVEVDGDVFTWTGSGWDLQENWDLV